MAIAARRASSAATSACCSLVLFLLGCQSSLFGPVKYSILPQLLHEDELVGGNALVEIGTFLAILLGTIAGGVVIAAGAARPRVDRRGRSSRSPSPAAPAACSCRAPRRRTRRCASRRTRSRPLRETYAVTRARRARCSSPCSASRGSGSSAPRSSPLLPIYTQGRAARRRARGHASSWRCSASASRIGSLLCERLSERKLELGLVPLGSIGMSVFAFDLFLAGVPTAARRRARHAARARRLPGPAGRAGASCVDLILLAVFSGFFIVPLNTLIQQRAEPAERSRVVAGSNILSALFMVASSGLLVAFFAARPQRPARSSLVARRAQRRGGDLHLQAAARVPVPLRLLDRRQLHVPAAHRQPRATSPTKGRCCWCATTSASSTG